AGREARVRERSEVAHEAPGGPAAGQDEVHEAVGPAVAAGRQQHLVTDREGGQRGGGRGHAGREGEAVLRIVEGGQQRLELRTGRVGAALVRVGAVLGGGVELEGRGEVDGRDHRP